MPRRGGVVVLTLTVMLVGCTGSGDSPAPTPSSTPPAATTPTAPTTSPTGAATPTEVAGDPDGLVVLDRGEEPWADLAATTPLDDRVAVAASSMTTLDLDGEVETTTTTADYRLGVVLDATDTTSLLVATTEELTTDAIPQVPSQLGRFEWTLTPSGQVVDMVASNWDEPVEAELRTLLSFSHLVLEVPGIPVGAGARWQRDVDGAEVVVTLDELDDDELQATVEVRSTPSDGELVVTSAGTWERDTLVALDVRTTSRATATREVVAEGTPTTARVEQVDDRHLVREPGP